MVAFAIVNELSLPFTNSYIAKDGLKDFCSTIQELRANKVTQIYSIKALKDFEIAPGVYFPEFLGRSEDKELSSRLKSVIANQIIPVITPIPVEEDEIYEVYMLSSCTHNGEKCVGLHCVYLWDSISLSFGSDDKWNVPILKITNEYLDGESAEINEVFVEIKNCSSKEHVESHSDYFKELNLSNLKGIHKRDFWDEKSNFFIKVRFCKEMEQCILEAPNDIFENMLKKLFAVEKGEKKINEFSCHPEGDTVHDNKKMSKQRQVTLPDGKEEVFYSHITSFRNGYRLTFKEIGDFVYIGYLGSHLTTKKYK